MRCVLIDDHQSVAGLGHDIGLVQLGLGRPKGIVQRGRIDRRRARIRGRRAGIQPGQACTTPIMGRVVLRGGLGQFPRHRATAIAGVRARRQLMSHTGPKSPQSRIGNAGGRTMTRFGQRMPQAAHDQAAHNAGIAEPHFGLGRMDIHIDQLRVDFHEQRHQRMPAARQKILIGTTHRPVSRRSVTGRPLTKRY